MKKTFLLLISVIILTIILLVLAGCSPKQEENISIESISEESISDNENILLTTDNSENEVVTTYVYSSFIHKDFDKKNVGVIGLRVPSNSPGESETYLGSCIINENGKILAEDIKGCTIQEKYVSLFKGGFEVYDTKNGELKFSDDSTDYDAEEYNAYDSITKSGYIFLEHCSKKFNGDDEHIYKIIDLEGNEIFKTDVGMGLKYIGEDVFALYEINSNNKWGYGVNCTLMDFSDRNNIKTMNDVGISSDAKIEQGLLCGSHTANILIDRWQRVNIYESDKILNSKVFYRDNGLYSIETYELVKDLSEGGVFDIEYFDGVYYVFSSTDFLYTMDDNFNYILQPEKKERCELIKTECGIIIKSYPTGNTLALIDKTGKIILNLREDYGIYDIGFKDDKNIPELGKIICAVTKSESSYSQLFNLETKEFLKIYR